MGTITGTQIIDGARDVSNMDTTRWPDADLLPFLNAAQREVVTYLPQANPITEILQPVAGSRQTLTGMGATRPLQVIELIRNFASNGTTVGNAIRALKGGKKWLDESRPTWHTDTVSGTIRHFATDEDDPLTVWVWPPHSGTGKVQARYSQLPSTIAAVGDVISLDDRYANAIQHYLLYRMYSRNEPGTRSETTAAQHYALFMQLLGVKEKRMVQQDRSKDEAPQ